MKILILFIVFLVLPGMLLSQGMQVRNTFRANTGASIHMNGNLTIDLGNLTLNPGAKLIIENERTLIVNEGGAIKALGNETDHAVITSTGYFSFIISNGGSIDASHTIFEKMSGSGLTIESGATVYTFSNCTFQNGNNGSTMLTINNNQYLTIDGAMFISLQDKELHNVTKTISQGIVNFINYHGNFTGENYEYDDFNRIFWGAEAPFEEQATGTIHSDAILCIDALDLIIAEDLLVENGGIIDLIAGQRILMIPGLIVERGGSLHAWIGSEFCQLPESLIASREVFDLLEEMVSPHLNNNSFISIFPNPTTGQFTAEIKEGDESDVVALQIFGILGEFVHSSELTGAGQYVFDLSYLQPGFYLLRAIKANKTQIIKIIKK